MSAAGLPHAERRHPAAGHEGAALDRLVGAMRAWAGAGHLDDASFAAHFFGRHPSSPVLRHLRRAAELVRTAATSADIRDATGELADAMLAVGLDGWPRFLMDAHARATAPWAVPERRSQPLLVPVQAGVTGGKGPAASASNRGGSAQTQAREAVTGPGPASPAGTPSVQQSPNVTGAQPAATPQDVADTPEARGTLANKLVKAGTQATDEDVAIVRKHVIEYVPADALRLMDKYGIYVQVTRDSVATEWPELRDAEPRGWGSSPMSKVTGIYDANRHAAIVATQANANSGRRLPDEREHGSIDVVLHEAGHGINRAASMWRNMSNKSDFIDAYKLDGKTGVFNRPYYHQESDGAAGRDEAWAEGFAMYHRSPSGMQSTYPNMFQYFQEFIKSELPQ